jgi:hypothetical protein
MDCGDTGVQVTDGGAFWTVYVPLPDEAGLLIHLPREGDNVVMGRCTSEELVAHTVTDAVDHWDELIAPWIRVHQHIWDKLIPWRHAHY